MANFQRIRVTSQGSRELNISINNKSSNTLIPFRVGDSVIFPMGITNRISTNKYYKNFNDTLPTSIKIFSENSSADIIILKLDLWFDSEVYRRSDLEVILNSSFQGLESSICIINNDGKSLCYSATEDIEMIFDLSEVF